MERWLLNSPNLPSLQHSNFSYSAQPFTKRLAVRSRIKSISSEIPAKCG